jgi:drug/metabolite transporter (DMT)-like permease
VLRFLPVAAALAGGIFLIDTLTSLQFAVASLYVIVVLIAAHDLHRRGVVITGVTCALLTVFSYVLCTDLRWMEPPRCGLR